MRHLARSVFVCVVAAGFGTTYAADNAKADDSVESLMTGDGSGTSFESKGWNSKGAGFDYQACHHPDGRIVARADYDGGKTYHASGRWETEEGRICVDWSTEGWIDICVSVAYTESGYEMMNVADGRKVMEGGAFENGYLDWCASSF